MADVRSGSLLVDVKPGQALDLGGMRVEVVHKSGRGARLRVTAPREVRITVVDTNPEIFPTAPRAVVPSTAR